MQAHYTDEKSGPRPESLDDYPLKTFDKIRYRDTDRQGHVNNALFSTFLETGRTELLYNPNLPLNSENCSFVIVKQVLELKAEIQWPGTVDIGTRVLRIGSSSVSLRQAIFQSETLCASAETVIVQINNTSRSSDPLCRESVLELEKYR